MDCFFVPGGTTKFVQCADVAWNNPFKALIRQFFEDWILLQAPERRKGGNSKASGMDIYLKWVSDVWDSIPEEVIRRSFKSYGIGIDPSGADDELIHCFKPDGPIPTGLQLLKDARVEKEIDGLLDPLSLANLLDFRQETERCEEESESDISVDLDF